MNAVRPITRSFSAAAVTLGLMALAFFPGPSGAADYSEDAVKAAYLYRFAGYIDWPERGSATTFTIDVLGAPGIARELRRLLPGHAIHGQAAQVREITGDRDFGTAQIVYIAAGHADLLRSLVPQANGASMLLVTDEEDGLSAGSILNFLTIDRNVRFEVSLSAAQRWGLKISSELLGVAIRVQGRSGQSFLGCGPSNDIEGTIGPCRPALARQSSRKSLLNPAPKRMSSPS